MEGKRIGEVRKYQLGPVDPEERVAYKNIRYRRLEMTANERQVGGEHYKVGGEEHWDRVARLDLDYFQAQITKYVERCWEKNGIEDLKKARHFLDKYIELKETQHAQVAQVMAEDNLTEAIIEGWAEGQRRNNPPYRSPIQMAREANPEGWKCPECNLTDGVHHPGCSMKAKLSEFAKVLKREDEEREACRCEAERVLAEAEMERERRRARAEDDGPNYDGEPCAHGNDPAECDACLVESDLRYDANRERGLS